MVVLPLSCSKKVYNYYDNGEIRKIEEYSRKGLLKCITGMYENGEVEYKFENAKLDTFEVSNEETQEVIIRVALSGLEFRYYNSGQLKERGMVLLGKKEGLWRYWDEGGKLIKEEMYINGELL